MAYSKEEKENIFNTIFDTIENGGSLRSALKIVKISSQTFFVWILEDEAKSKQYVLATEKRADAIFEEILEIADEGHGTFTDELGNIKIDSASVQKKRLQIDTRKWMLGKLNPKKYGDKMQTEHSGEIKTVNLTDEEVKKINNNLEQSY
jgi:Transposase